jgi:hypothetical protein
LIYSRFGGNITSAVEAAVVGGTGGIVYVSGGPCIQMANGEQLDFAYQILLYFILSYFILFLISFFVAKD